MKKIPTILLLLSGWFAVPCEAQTTVLAPVADTYLRSGGSNQNQGSETFLRVQSSGNNRSLVRFDTTAIAGAVGSGSLASARLELYIESNSNNWGSDGRTVDAHRLTANWSEAGATWNCGIDSNPNNGSADCSPQWAGGSFAEEPSDTVLHTNGLTGWIRFDVTGDVLAALAGTPAYGWMVKKSEEGQNGGVEYTSRQGTTDRRPRLVLVVESAAFDQVPPSLSITSPSRSVLVNEPSLEVAATFADGGSGPAPATFRLLLDGQDATASCTVSATSASCHPSPWTAGSHALQVEIRDQAGNLAQASFGFQLLLGSGPHLVTLPAAGDTHLRQGTANENDGGEPILRLQKSGTHRALVRFDSQALATTLAGATLVSASLELHVEKNGRNWGAQGREVSLHRLTAPWTEMGATWSCPIDTNPTNNQADCAAQWGGGSFAATPTATRLHTNALAGWVSYDVTADVAAFLAGSPANGWLLKRENEGQSGRVDYDSRQGTAGEGPRLVLVFQTATGGDTTPPTLDLVTPASALRYRRPDLAVLFRYADSGSGILPGSFRFLLDGADQTAACALSATSALCPLASLSAGPHAISASVLDRAGHSSTATLELDLVVDETAPAIRLLAPAALVVHDRSPEIELELEDSGSGIDEATLQLQLGANDLAPACRIDSGRALCALEELPDGDHSFTASIADRAGNPASLQFSFRTAPDTEAPTLAIVAPASALVVNDPRPVLEAEYSDAGSGIARESVEVRLDGGGITGSCLVGERAVTCWPPDLAAGDHTFQVEVKDQANNAVSASKAFATLSDATPPVIALASPATGAAFRVTPVPVSGTVSDDESVASLTVGGVAVPVVAGAFSTEAALAEGENFIEVVARDRAGRESVTRVSVFLDTVPPVLTVEKPLAGARANTREIPVAGLVSDGGNLVQLELNGAPLGVAPDGTFSVSAPLEEGANVLRLRAVDRAGNTAGLDLPVRSFSLPEVEITQPVDLSYIAATTIDVSGTVSDPGASVSVNGIGGTVSGTTFLVADVPLTEGGNIVTATATGADGHVGTGTINIVRDLQAPRLAVSQPSPGAVVFEPTVRVSGLVNDIVPGTVNAPQATVTVNGRPALVANRSFEVAEVPLALGDNELVVRAVDAGGNPGEIRVTVRREAPTVPRIAVTGGDAQQAVIGTQLPQPLRVTLLDAAGLPIAGRAVLFKVRGNNGSLAGGERWATATTDAQGRAASPFTLGTRVGVGLPVVEASAVGFRGPAVFTATAHAAEPSRLFVDSGGQQVGIPGHRLPRPLVAVVTDAGYNRLEGVPVRFSAALGGGTFEGGESELTVLSDGDGRAIVDFEVGPEEGIANQVVEAAIEGQPAVSFTASARGAGEAAQTSVTGVVLDNANLPIAGVSVRILYTEISVRTNEAGFFRIDNAPVGTITLIIDGSTAERPGSWPDLEYVVTTIPGRETTVEMPIYLLPLHLPAGVPIDEVRGGTVRLAELPGFALEVAPGTVIFPGGSRSGVISVTAVHNDRVPMVPNFGQQPRLIVTIQPAGARFDPPARLTMPNLEGLAPGEVTELYSFDHDLGHFVSIGPATVSEDGQLIVANPGVGVIKAGWHCGGNPSSSGTPHACKECWRCTGSACVPVGGAVAQAAPAAVGAPAAVAPAAGSGALSSVFAAQSIFACEDDGNICTFDQCFAGKCKHDPVPDALMIKCPPDDLDTCTNHICKGGKCSREPKKCDECDKCELGECATDPAKNDKPCEDDADPCTKDVCTDGECQHKEKKIESADFKLANGYRDVRVVREAEIVFDSQPAQFESEVESEDCDPVYDWKLGDGNNTSGESPSHSYAKTGTYTVEMTVKCGDCERTKKTASHEIKVGFLATCYFRASEDEYGAPYLDNPNGLTGRYSQRFLQQVRLQGSGVASSGQFIQVDFGRGNPHAGFSQTFFQVVGQINGAGGRPLTLSSIAVDTGIIPFGTTVNVEGLGSKTADDTGGAIHGYHIDVFMGNGRQVCQGWGNPIVPITGY